MRESEKGFEAEMQGVLVPTILVVDDNADTRQVMRWMIERWGYRVLEASDGRQAFEVAAESHPALILMDLSMPVVDGFDAIRFIRGDTDISDTPIIAVTAFDRAASRDGADAAGFDHYLSKPIDFYRLEVLLKKLIRAR